MSISSLSSSALHKFESIVKFVYNNTTYYGGRSWSFVKNSVIKSIPTAMQKYLVVGLGVTAVANLLFIMISDTLAKKVETQPNGLRKGAAIFGAGLLVSNLTLQWATGFPVNKMIPVTIAIVGAAYRVFSSLRPDDVSYAELLTNNAKSLTYNRKLLTNNAELTEENKALKKSFIILEEANKNLMSDNNNLRDQIAKIDVQPTNQTEVFSS
jgi:hypothetical protein